MLYANDELGVIVDNAMKIKARACVHAKALI
jgi:hypothetical protein